ncbi:RNA polymerase I-specific transcription-initiation factor-domain-containing protein [Lipomyces arxii]|uniref:RNA polymerase I-specific transcription-initiation factor-domain-containing protein n=1 Tax=Lipomyces arxii TaxID=56418 RepID=UPI0034CEC44B
MSRMTIDVAVKWNLVLHPDDSESFQTKLIDVGYGIDYMTPTKQKCIAYSGGVSGNVLNISNLTTDSYKLDGYQNVHLDVPGLGSSRWSSDLREHILGVAFAGSEFSSSTGPLLCARSSTSCYFYQPVFATSEIDQTQIATADLLLSINSRFADVSFNPWYWHQFGTVDAYGNWQVNDLNHGSVTIFTSGCANTLGVKENMRKYDIQWGSNLNNMLISNSGLIQSIDLRSHSSVQTYEPRTTSRIRDVKMVPETTHELIVATTGELIWMDLRMFPKEQLAWNHSMDYKVLKCSPFVDEDDVFALLYSPSDPVISCFQFGTRDDVTYSLADPYAFGCYENTRPLYMVPSVIKLSDSSDLDELDPCSFLSVMTLSNDYTLSQRIYCTDSVAIPRSSALESRELYTTHFDDTMYITDHEMSTDTDTEPVRKVDFSRLYNLLFDSHQRENIDQPSPTAGSSTVEVPRSQDSSAIAALNALSEIASFNEPKLRKSGNINQIVSDWK